MRPNRHRFLNAFIHPQPRSNASASRRRCLRLKPIGVYLIIAIVVASVTVIVIAAVFFSRHHDEVSEIKVVVDLAYAQYEGRTLSNGVSQWLGIRYGQNPVGDLRFRDAKEPLYASGLQSAVKHGPQCISTSTRLPVSQSEDCLFLDVYAPATPVTLLPVFVFIQGGGFNSLSNQNYNGTGLIIASGNNLCVVTFNYRVGLYGFLASKEVVNDGDTNVGLKDQRKVLQWVKANIQKFGCDPNHVTLGGDSAGAAAIAAQLTAYGGRDDKLFHATAAQSTSFGPKLDVNGSQYQYDALIARTGCNTTTDSLSCLRAKTPAQLQAVNVQIPSPGRARAPLFMYNPVIDGDFTRTATYDAFARGNYVKLPAIWGSDTNDGTIFAPRSINSTTAQTSFVVDQFPKLNSTQAAHINTLYPKGLQFPESGQFWQSAANAYGEMRYLCPGLYISSLSKIPDYPTSASEQWNIPNYTYRYNVIDPADARSGLGAKHTVETGAIWGPNNVQGSAPLSYSTTVNEDIVRIMQGYWTSFIRSYNPNLYRGVDTPIWESYNQTSRNRIRFETNTTAMEPVDEEQLKRCEYLWAIGKELDQ